MKIYNFRKFAALVRLYSNLTTVQVFLNFFLLAFGPPVGQFGNKQMNLICAGCESDSCVRGFGEAGGNFSGCNIEKKNQNCEY